MTKRSYAVLLTLFALVAGLAPGAAAAAGEYDFYAGTKYPGAALRPDVEIYKVAQAGGPYAEGYQRRVVQWWPRKGVDIIEVKPGMPLRTWTWRTKPQWGAPAAFKAHLVGFRGIGNTMSSKFRGDGGPLEPAVVLRLPDGRKRCFVRGSFGNDDKKYIMALYVKEMNRIKAGLDKTKLVKRPDADINWPNNAKPGEPGTMQVECEHFIWLSGSQAGSDGDPWVNAISPEKAQWFRDGSIQCAEYWWALNEYAGHLMPYWDRTKQFKYQITVPGTKRDGYKVIPGYAGGGYGGCGIKGAGGGPWSMALFHEWGHGALSNRWRVGGGEAQADAHQCLAGPVLKGNHHIKTPWRNIFNGSMGYGYTVFYSIVGDDPNRGYNWFSCLPSGAGEHTLMQIAARVDEQRGLFKNGIRGFGDMMGDYGARLATFDCELEELFRRAYFAPARSWLEPVDREKRVYRIPFEESPEPYGVNIVRLVADEAAGQIVVDFAGLHDPDFYSDWRACIVAVGADGKSRYSPMWNKGKMALKRLAGDWSYWLTVSATPTAMYGAGGSQAVYSGRHAYRYPWSVRLTGARPGTPRECRADLPDRTLRYKTNDSVPAPHDTAAGKAYLRMLSAFIEQLGSAEQTSFKAHAQAEIQRMTKGRRHANGGGWVAQTAQAAASAYVGPDAMVLAQAKVLDQAIIEDYAVVTGSAVVSGHARISGQAVVKDAAKAGGYSRTWGLLAKTDVATVVPKRLAAKALDASALWANYAMDRDEKTVLEDWYRFAHGADRRYGRRLGTNLNGYLYGRPEFVIDGERRGFRFDGKKQYAELCPRVADLGEITVDIALKWEGKGSQTIFDFGSSGDNCLVLRTDGNGRCELVATVAGKVLARAAAKKTLAPNKWVRLRVEIDGEKMGLWIDGAKAASQATTFRPCDAFAAGREKRNFIAAARDGAGHFKGTLDYLRVYHTVYEDFTKAPEPRRHAPRRVTREFIDSYIKKRSGAGLRAALVGAKVKPLSAYYGHISRNREKRVKEIEESSPAVAQARRGVQQLEQKLNRRKKELEDEFNKLPETIKRRAELKALEDKVRALQAKRNEAAAALDAKLKTKYKAENKALIEANEKALAEAKEKQQQAKAQVQRLEESFKSLPEIVKLKDENQRAIRLAELRVNNAEYVRWRIAEAEAGAEAARVASKVGNKREKSIGSLIANDPKIVKLDRQIRNHRARMFRPDSRGYVANGTVELARQIIKANIDVNNAVKENIANYRPEHNWLGSLRWHAFSGYYNYAYRSYIRDYMRRKVGGGEEPQENIGALESIYSAQTTAKWHTRCDWQWRMRQELDGSIEEMPLMRKWLKRVRGNVRGQE